MSNLPTVPENPIPYRDLPEETKESFKQDMYEQFCKGLTLKEIAETYQISYRTIVRYSKDGNWSEEKAKLKEELKDLETVDDQADLPSKAIDSTLRALNKMAADLNRDIQTGKEPTVNYKNLVDALDKAVKLRMHVDTGGVTKTEHTVNKKVQTLDWNKLIESAVKAKKEHGEGFNEKEFLKNVIDAEVVKEVKK